MIEKKKSTVITLEIQWSSSCNYNSTYYQKSKWFKNFFLFLPCIWWKEHSVMSIQSEDY